MANIVKHRFASAKADGADATQIQPSHWNDGHNFAGGTAGDVLTRDPTDVNFGARWSAFGTWQLWTPNWSALLVAPAIADGNVYGRYAVVGRTVTYALRLASGASTNFGSGNWMFTLPYPANVDYQSLIIGGALVRTNADVTYTGVAIVSTLNVAGANDRVTAAINTGSQHTYAPLVQATIPFSWAGQGHWLYLSGSYEIAPGAVVGGADEPGDSQ